MKLKEGQCGLCSHFGGDGPDDEKLVQIRSNKEAPEDFKETCGHPTHQQLHLMVTANSGCDAFAPAASA